MLINQNFKEVITLIAFTVGSEVFMVVPMKNMVFRVVQRQPNVPEERTA
jgi:hypothetical protein